MASNQSLQRRGSQRRPVLSTDTLEELQSESGNDGVPLSQLWSKLYSGNLYSDFDKEVLKLKPNDCAIVQKYSKMETFPITGRKFETVTLNAIYSDHPLREFHRRSMKKLKDGNVDEAGLAKAEAQLNRIDSLPVLVFIHGLGGQLSQFEPILQEFRNCADIFGLDLPGFGNSKPGLDRQDPSFARLSQYSEEEIAKLEACLKSMDWSDFESDQLADLIAQILEYKFPKRQFVIVSHSMGTHLSIKTINRLSKGRVEALVMLSPPKLSVKAGQPMALPYTARKFLELCSYYPRLLDLARMYDRQGGLYSKSVDTYIYGAEADALQRVTQFRWNLDTNSQIFLKYLFGFHPATAEELLQAAAKVPTKSILVCCGDHDRITPLGDSQGIVNIVDGAKLEVVERANHSLFLDRPHIVAGVVYQFLLDLGLNLDQTWVLQVKATISGDKWSMKNVQKWDRAVTLSEPLVNPHAPQSPSPLLGMKTLRETDETHNPKVFEEQHPEIYGIVDIGSDTPSYDPDDFKRIKYTKFKTESKVTPDDVTIAKFIEKIDQLVTEKQDDQYIVVHCHYGQNRTGFLICCYLVERLGWSVKDALAAFKTSKSPGVKHVHFRNALYLRYGE